MTYQCYAACNFIVSFRAETLLTSKICGILQVLVWYKYFLNYVRVIEKSWVIIAVKRFAMSKQLINKTIILVTEIAVVTDKKLELLDSNGMLVGSTINLTAELKTLAFDNARSQFIVSDRVSQNDSIFSVLLTNLQKAPPVNETKVTPLVTNLPDDVQVGKLIKQFEKKIVLIFMYTKKVC